jgi:putative DNA primase/helicase
MNGASTSLGRETPVKNPGDTPKEYADLAIQYTVFDNVFGTQSHLVTSNWATLVALLTSPKTYANKKFCPLLKLATFGDRATASGSLRSDDNLKDIFGIEGDYDSGEISMEEAATRIEHYGIEGFLYTTPSHAPSRPRWRVLAPLSRAHLPAERAKLTAMLNWALGGILQKESFTNSQTYYFGRVDGIEYQVTAVRGNPIDLLDVALGETYPSSDSSSRKAKKVEQKSNGSQDEPYDLDRAVTLDRFNDKSHQDLQSALSVDSQTGKPWIDPDDRVTWIAVGNGLKSLGDVGRELWTKWSALSLKFNDGGDDPTTVWESCRGDRADYRAVFTKASASGWINPRSAAARQQQENAETRVDRTDAGNVTVLANLCKGKLRYVIETKRWLWWTGSRWESCSASIQAQQQALQVAQWYQSQANELRAQANSQATDEKERMQLEKVIESTQAWVKHCRNKRALDNMLSLALNDQRFAIYAELLDSKPFLLGVQNGVVDLRTGTLRPDAREDFVTKRCTVNFDTAAKTPLWEKFISEITSAPGAKGSPLLRPALAAYLQRGLGYTLTGDTSEHKMFIVVGEGSNGKNVLLDTVQYLMGDYCITISPDALMATRNGADPERATPSTRKLAGARMAISSESKDGQRLDVGLVKRQTGDKRMTARALHENQFTFDITHKVWLMTNHKPSLDHLDEAVRGRLHLIPFDMRWNRPGHPDPDPKLPTGDKTLFERLKAEAVGILTWLVVGAVRYRRDGLEPPAEVAGLTNTYFKDQDALGLWLATCKPCNPSDGKLAVELLDNLHGFCKVEDLSLSGLDSAGAFGKKLKSKGVAQIRTNKGSRYGLLPENEFESAFEIVQK